jgi:hypothetical protein
MTVDDEEKYSDTLWLVKVEETHEARYGSQFLSCAYEVHGLLSQVKGNSQ